MNEDDFDSLIELIDDLRGEAYESGTLKHGLMMIDDDRLKRLAELCNYNGVI